MKAYTYVTLRQKPELKEKAAAWFHDKWEVPQAAYLNHETEYGWYEIKLRLLKTQSYHGMTDFIYTKR